MAARGITTEPPKANPNRNKNKAKNQKKEAKQKYGEFATHGYAGLNDAQSAVINQTNAGDFQLGQTAQGQLPGIQNAYSQPFDYSQLPQSPWEQGQTIKDMEGQYYDRALDNYNRSMKDQWKREDDDLAQWAHNTGNPIGSPAYNAKAKILQDSRASQTQNAQDSAYFNSSQNATTWNNLSSSNFKDAYAFGQDKRNQPLADYTAIMGAQSQMPTTNLAGSQAYGLQQNDIANQRWMMQHTPRGGGGGGGGGGAPPYGGFGSQAEYWAAQDARNRANLEYELQLKQKYGPQQPSQPSYGSQLGGGILGSLATGWALGGFKSPW